jgi:hypothetical protein
VKSPLPVDPERLRAQFPALTDTDLRAYVVMTQRVLADPRRRAATLKTVLAAGRDARERLSHGLPLDDEQGLALGYVQALEKMQRPTTS